MRHTPGFTALLVAFTVAAVATAEWDVYPLERAIPESDLVVVGMLQEVSEESGNGVDLGRGSIRVVDVLWGEAQPGDELRLVWSNPTGLACPRVEQRPYVDKEIIWLLTAASDSTVEANHPDRHVSLEVRDEIENLLVTLPVLVSRDPSGRAFGEHSVRLGYRNAGTEPRSFPGLEYDDGTLTCETTGVVLQVREGAPGSGGRPVKLVGAIEVDGNMPPLVVPPGEEAGVTVDLDALFDMSELAGLPFTVYLSVPGLSAHEWSSTGR